MSTPLFPPPPISTTKSSALLKWLLLAGTAAIAVGGWYVVTHIYRDYKICHLAAERFHAHLDRGEYEAIYGEASDDFRKAAPHDHAITFLTSVHQKLGTVQGMKFLGFHENTTTRGTLANQVFETKFGLGTGQEQFLWRMGGTTPLLVGYHVNSTNLR